MTGIYCATSTGAQFGQATLRSSEFSDANQWNSDPSYWSTIQYADVNGDGWLDVCGRAPTGTGIICALNNGVKDNVQFISPVFWTTNQYTDAFGWRAPEYSSTIHFADINGDGAADVCGRGRAGFIAACRPITQPIRLGHSRALNPLWQQTLATKTAGIRTRITNVCGSSQTWTDTPQFVGEVRTASIVRDLLVRREICTTQYLGSASIDPHRRTDIHCRRLSFHPATRFRS